MQRWSVLKQTGAAAAVLAAIVVRWRLPLALVVLVSVAGAAALWQGGVASTGGDGDGGARGTPDGETVAVDATGGFPMSAPSIAPEKFTLSAEASMAVAPEPALYGSSAAALLDRQIIRNGSIDIEVESVVDAYERVSAVATAAGGFVADSTFYGREKEQSARITVRVPAQRFESVLAEMRAMAVEVRSVSTSSQDVTGEVTDMESELRNLRAVEGQYLALLDRADTIGEVLQVQDRLNQTRLQIDRTEGRIQLLARLSDLATLSVNLHPVESPPPVAPNDGGPLEAARQAWEASLATLSTVATVLIFGAVYSWWLLPVLAVAVLVLRRWRPETRTVAASIDTPEGTA